MFYVCGKIGKQYMVEDTDDGVVSKVELPELLKYVFDLGLEIKGVVPKEGRQLSVFRYTLTSVELRECYGVDLQIRNGVLSGEICGNKMFRLHVSDYARKLSGVLQVSDVTLVLDDKVTVEAGAVCRCNDGVCDFSAIKDGRRAVLAYRMLMNGNYGSLSGVVKDNASRLKFYTGVYEFYNGRREDDKKLCEAVLERFGDNMVSALKQDYVVRERVQIQEGSLSDDLASYISTLDGTQRVYVENEWYLNLAVQYLHAVPNGNSKVAKAAKLFMKKIRGQ